MEEAIILPAITPASEQYVELPLVSSGPPTSKDITSSQTVTPDSPTSGGEPPWYAAAMARELLPIRNDIQIIKTDIQTNIQLIKNDIQNMQTIISTLIKTYSRHETDVRALD
ncbi:hypothetical protein B0H34DRAFT_676295 [Crassisporium funariophilum]|nr:hypothetical protein B0H34DRAFT_676295 [Crassisporium funariophilum]